MIFHVMTLFPEMVEQGLHTSILGRAMDAGIIGLNTVNIRDYSDLFKWKASHFRFFHLDRIG